MSGETPGRAASSRVFGLLATAGLLAAVIVHGATFFAIDLASGHPAAWLLHIGCLLISLPFAEQRGDWRGFLRNAWSRPAWARWLVLMAAVYAGVNFGLYEYRSEGASADIRDGRAVLQRHGTIVRQISAEEFRQQKLYVTRSFSGLWILAYLIPAVVFLTRAGGRPRP